LLAPSELVVDPARPPLLTEDHPSAVVGAWGGEGGTAARHPPSGRWSDHLLGAAAVAMDVDGGHPPAARAPLLVGVANGGGGSRRRPRDTDRAERGGVRGCDPSRGLPRPRSDAAVVSAGDADVAVGGPAARALARRARRGVEGTSPASARGRKGRRAAAATAADGTPRWATAAVPVVGASIQTTADVEGTGSATRIDAGGRGVHAAAVAVCEAGDRRLGGSAAGWLWRDTVAGHQSVGAPKAGARPSEETATTGWAAGPKHPPAAAVGGHPAVGDDAAGGDGVAAHDPNAPTDGGTSHWRDAHPAVAAPLSAPARAVGGDPACTPAFARGTPITDGGVGVGAKDNQGGGVDACAGAVGAAAVATTAPTGSRTAG